MALFLLRFWPVLVPLLVYLAWMQIVRRKAQKAGQPLPHFRDGPWFWMIVASLCIAVFMFVFLGLSHEAVRGEYEPPHMENGKIISGKVKP
jgi:uncharacterized membrane protein